MLKANTESVHRVGGINLIIGDFKVRKVKVWTCKIIVSGDSELPPGFDSPPRWAATGAIENEGIEVIGCSSGWGGSLTKEEKEAYEAQAIQAYPSIYFAGAMDADDSSVN